MSAIAFFVNAVMIVARALVPIAGLVFLGWSAPKLLAIYFADTAAAYYTFLAALALASPARAAGAPAPSRSRPGGGLRAVLRAVMLPLPTLALVGFFFGILPLFVMLDVQGIPWSDFLADRSLWAGIALQFALALGAIIPRAWGHAAASDGSFRLLAAALTLRWLVMILVGFFMAPGIPRVVYGPLLVILYAVMTAALELTPGRVFGWVRRVVP